MSSCKISRERR